jgi:hypothetical protein
MAMRRQSGGWRSLLTKVVKKRGNMDQRLLTMAPMQARFILSKIGDRALQKNIQAELNRPQIELRKADPQ